MRHSNLPLIAPQKEHPGNNHCVQHIPVANFIRIVCGVITCLLDAQILYDGEALRLQGYLPSQRLTLDKLLRPTSTDDAPQNSFRPLQSGPSSDSLQGEADNSNWSYRNNKGSMLWFYKSSLRFSVAISLENLRKFRVI